MIITDKNEIFCNKQYFIFKLRHDLFISHKFIFFLIFDYCFKCFQNYKDSRIILTFLSSIQQLICRFYNIILIVIIKNWQCIILRYTKKIFYFNKIYLLFNRKCFSRDFYFLPSILSLIMKILNFLYFKRAFISLWKIKSVKFGLKNILIKYYK